MLRNIFIIAALLCSLIGCRPPGTSGSGFGNSSVILKDVFDSGLADYQLTGAEIRWSGTDGGDDYSRRGSVTVKDADQKQVADLLDKKLESLPTKYSWTGHSLSRNGDRYLGFSYEDNSGKFYIDFILNQQDKDVNILVLSKGVRD